MNRRSFLKKSGSAAITTPLSVKALQTMINSIALGFVQKAIAKENDWKTGVSPRNFVGMRMGMGPMRLSFDQALKAHYNTQLFGEGSRDNPIGTQFAPGGRMVYGTVPIRANGGISKNSTVNMPPLWGSNAPSSGGTKPLARILENALFMQGIRNLADGHDLNANLLFAPIPGSSSITGLIAQASVDFPREGRSPLIPMIGSHPSFKSPGGVAPMSGDFRSLISMFSRENNEDQLDAEFVSKRNFLLDRSVATALKAIGEFSKSQHPQRDAVFSLRHTAEIALKKNFSTLFFQYEAAKDRYYNIKNQIGTGLRENKPWLPKDIRDNNTAVMVHDFNPKFRISTKDGKHDNYVDMPNINLQNAVPGGPLNMMFKPEDFAMTEIMLKEKLSSTIVLTGEAIHTSTEIGLPAGCDSHDVGIVLDVLASTFSFYGVAAMLGELTDQLKSAGIYNETVIQIASDFARNVRNSGNGSDHGWEGSSISLFSGVIQGLNVGGNVKVEGSGDYKYTWGLGANVAKPDRISGPLKHENVVTTICNLTRVRSPSANFYSIIKPLGSDKDSQFVLDIEPTRLI